MSKKKKTPPGIFLEAFGLYFANFGKFFKYMSFPVLGQIAGLGVVFIFTYYYSKNLPFLIERFPVFNNFSTLVLCSISIALPGIAIFIKAFWEYLVAYGAVNSMLENMLKSGRLYDFNAHTELIKRRLVPFMGLWLLFGIFSIIAVIPIFWVPCGVLAIYFVLVFQVFTYEPELSPVGCAKKSMLLIHKHFASTFMLMAVTGALTYIFIPQIINTICSNLKITDFLCLGVTTFAAELPVEEVNQILAEFYIPPVNIQNMAEFTVTAFISQIFIQYTLPARSILWGLWYKELNDSLPSPAEKKYTSHTKKPCEKLMEETHKKSASKKLDGNILKRAMEKDDEE